MIGTPTIKKLDKALTEGLKKELRDQGHYLTGALEASIKSTTKQSLNSEVLEIAALDYINKLDTGIPANQINLSDPAYIEGLTQYVQKRMGYQGTKARQVAYAIAKKHKREGMPTRSSYQYSFTGERTNVLEETYKERIFDPLIDKGLNTEVDNLIDKSFDTTIF